LIRSSLVKATSLVLQRTSLIKVVEYNESFEVHRS